MCAWALAAVVPPAVRAAVGAGAADREHAERERGSEPQAARARKTRRTQRLKAVARTHALVAAHRPASPFATGCWRCWRCLRRTGTGTDRLHMQNEEGGIVEEEFRVAYVVDRVNTFGTAFLGLTFECSPVPRPQVRPDHAEGFLLAVRLLPEHRRVGPDVVLHRADAGPDAPAAPTTPPTRKLADLDRRIAAKEARAPRRPRPGRATAFERWLASRPSEPDAAGPGRRLRVRRRSTTARSPTPSMPRSRAAPSRARSSSPGKVGQAVELGGENGFTFPGVGHFTRADPFSLGALAPGARRRTPSGRGAPPQPGPDRRRQPRATSCCSRTAASPFGLHHMWPGNSLKVVTDEADPGRASGRTSPSPTTAPSRAAGVRIYVDGEPADARGDPRRARQGHHLRRRRAGPGDRLPVPRQRVQGRARSTTSRVFDRALTPLEVADLAGRPDLARGPRRAGPASCSTYFLATTSTRPRGARRRSCTPSAGEQSRLVEPDPRGRW